jgi:transposase InsO family protein
LLRFPGAGVRALADLLEDDTRRLDVLALGDHRVRRRLRHRYERLGRTARRALRRMAASGLRVADARSLGQLLGADAPAASRLLDELADSELVEVTAGADGHVVYRLDGLAGCFAREVAASRPQAARPVAPLAAVAGSAARGLSHLHA